jgi:hypothetical protein
MNLKARIRLEELSDHYRSVVGSTVPEHHDRPPSNVTEEVAQECNDLGSTGRVLVDSEVEAISGGHPADR